MLLLSSLGEEGCATLVSSAAEIEDNEENSEQKNHEETTNIETNNELPENIENNSSKMEKQQQTETVPDWIIDVQPLIDFINSVSFLKSK